MILYGFCDDLYYKCNDKPSQIVSTKKDDLKNCVRQSGAIKLSNKWSLLGNFFLFRRG